ncbi:hypothetical protein LQ327_01060 [Actinomycetospora endophytica]|uniref:Uncharacterized protein n=1 Tax=Actinomycetospora endophytica TaxID=2291215 RepID=A0ABS8P4I8_9PSEU|nr:hypothetical protein [Actinomycetospora endophytica]MCD2191979.1 hypothetical protein [Actinomycetospora endophytica]
MVPGTATGCCLVDERELVRAQAAVGLASDGELVATSHRVLFEPWSLGLVDWLLQYGCAVSDGSPVYIVGTHPGGAECTGRGAGEIVGARPISAAPWTSTPTLGIEKSDGTEAVFGVAGSGPSQSHRAARDELLAVIAGTFLGSQVRQRKS